MAFLTTEALQRVYGQELAGEPYVSLKSPRYLYKALRARSPPLAVSDEVYKQWFQKYRTPVGAVRVETVQALEAGYGPLVRQVQIDAGGSVYKLCGALRKQQPAVYITDAIARAWL